MNNIHEIYKELTGKHPEKAEIDEILKVKNTLGISENDALFSVIILLHFNKTLYEDIPREIKAILTGIPDNISSMVENEVKLAQARLTNTIMDEAKKMSKKRGFIQELNLTLINLLIVIFVGCFSFITGFTFGTHKIQMASFLMLPSGIFLSILSFTIGIFSLTEFIKKYSSNLKGKKSLFIGITGIAMSAIFLAVTLRG